MELGARIKEHRTRCGISQEDLARRVYVARQTVSNWETDKTYPDVQSLLLLANLNSNFISTISAKSMTAVAKTAHSTKPAPQARPTMAEAHSPAAVVSPLT